MTDVGVSALTPQPAPITPPVGENLGQTPAEKAAALAAAQAAATAIRPPDLTRANALTEIDKLKRDPEFAKKLHAGATEETKRWRDLHKIAASPETADESAAELTKRFTALQAFGLPGPDTEAGRDLLEVLKGKPISLDIRRQVEARRTALMRDPGWVKRYLDGDVEARKAMATIAVLMSARVERAA